MACVGVAHHERVDGEGKHVNRRESLGRRVGKRTLKWGITRKSSRPYTRTTRGVIVFRASLSLSFSSPSLLSFRNMRFPESCTSSGDISFRGRLCLIFQEKVASSLFSARCFSLPYISLTVNVG